MGGGGFDHDEDATKGCGVGCGCFGRVLGGGVGLVHGTGQGDNTLGRVHCEVGDIGGGDGASNVLSHGSVSFSFV